MSFGMETVTMIKRQERKMRVAEMKMLRFSLVVTSSDRCRNGTIRVRLGVIELGAKLREARLRWMGHVCPRENNYFGNRVERPLIGRKRKRWRDNIPKDLRVIGAQEEDAMERVRWSWKIHPGDPHLVGLKPKKKEKEEEKQES